MNDIKASTEKNSSKILLTDFKTFKLQIEKFVQINWNLYTYSYVHY